MMCTYSNVLNITVYVSVRNCKEKQVLTVVPCDLSKWVWKKALAGWVSNSHFLHRSIVEIDLSTCELVQIESTPDTNWTLQFLKLNFVNEKKEEFEKVNISQEFKKNLTPSEVSIGSNGTLARGDTCEESEGVCWKK